MELLLANNAESTLLAGITAGALALSIQAADAAKFPVPGANQYFKATLVVKNTNAKEIVHVTANAAGVFTIVRAQEGTVALALSAGDVVALRATRDTLALLYSGVKQNFTPVASANDLVVLPGHTQITGAVQVNRISNAGFAGGQPVFLKFNGAPTVKHNQGGAGALRPIFLKGAVDRVAAAGATMHLRYDELDNIFYEF